jgi:NADH:ubiquinone oxidoreductase subunit D
MLGISHISDNKAHGTDDKPNCNYRRQECGPKGLTGNNGKVTNGNQYGGRKKEEYDAYTTVTDFHILLLPRLSRFARVVCSGNCRFLRSRKLF